MNINFYEDEEKILFHATREDGISVSGVLEDEDIKTKLDQMVEQTKSVEERELDLELEKENASFLALAEVFEKVDALEQKVKNLEERGN